MAIKQGILYLFGGLVEDSNDRQFTHKDLYALGNDFFPILSKLNTDTETIKDVFYELYSKFVLGF